MIYPVCRPLKYHWLDYNTFTYVSVVEKILTHSNELRGLPRKTNLVQIIVSHFIRILPHVNPEPNAAKRMSPTILDCFQQPHGL